jgi:hypothetical protein
VISTQTISTCVPTYITSVITVYPSPSAPAGGVPSSPAGGAQSSSVVVTKPYGTAAPSTYTPSSNNTVPFTGAASSQKAGGLLIAVGLAAAALF